MKPNAATRWQDDGPSGGRSTDFGADGIQYNKLDRSAEPGSAGATFVMVVQTAEVQDGNDPAIAGRLVRSRDWRVNRPGFVGDPTM